MTELDARLKRRFATPATAPDESFVAHVNRAIMAEEKLIAAQAAMWRRFAADLAGATAVVGAFYVLWRMAPAGVEVDLLSTAPAMAASMVLLLWLGVQLKPAGALAADA